MELLSINLEGKIEVAQDVLGIPEIYELWKRDKSKEKKFVVKELGYIYYMFSNRSPYRDLPENKRAEHVRKDFVKSKEWIPDEEVRAAIAKFKLLQETPESRLVSVFKEKAYGVADLLEGTPVSIETLGILLKLMGEVDGILDSVKSLEKKAKEKEEESNRKLIGGGTLNKFEI